MKEKFQRFMIGRYGVDELGKYSLYLTIALLILGLFVRSRFLNGVTFLIVLLLYFRMFSKNYAQRRKENDLFLKYKNQVVLFFNKEKRMMQDRVKFHIYTCPSCGTETGEYSLKTETVEYTDAEREALLAEAQRQAEANGESTDSLIVPTSYTLYYCPNCGALMMEDEHEAG